IVQERETLVWCSKEPHSVLTIVGGKDSMRVLLLKSSCWFSAGLTALSRSSFLPSGGWRFRLNQRCSGLSNGDLDSSHAHLGCDAGSGCLLGDDGAGAWLGL
ncbi:MAG: hypothetical protein ACPIOQ_68580, partial [Promethearchaeia archaeon]